MTRQPGTPDSRPAGDVALAAELIRRKAPVHLLGVGGVGMSGLAVLLAGRGLPVSGCDLHPNAQVQALRARGIPCRRGHAPGHVRGAVAWAVRSTAVSAGHPECAAARAAGKPVLGRGAVLAALMEQRRAVAVSGTHGKTTTAFMILRILRGCGLRPGYCIGGELAGRRGTAAAGKGRILVAEADESDGSCALARPAVAVITNIDFDHMEHFDDCRAFEECLRTFASHARERLVYCKDDPAAARILGRPFPDAWTYGLDAAAAIRGSFPQGARDPGLLQVSGWGSAWGTLRLPVPGRHNALNALGALAAAYALDLDPAGMLQALERFRPARRRFETVCRARGITVVSDYAHHPAEIKALVAMARPSARGRLLVIFQPHRYTRTRALGVDFPRAFDGLDHLWITPVYAASEAPLPGGTARDLFGHFEAQGRSAGVTLCSSLRAAWARARATLRAGDLLLLAGAGDVESIGHWARRDLAGKG